MQSNLLNFRADDALVDAIQSAAAREGVSVSEVIRRAVRNSFAVESQPHSPLCFGLAKAAFFDRPDNGGPSPFESASAGQPFDSAEDPLHLLEQAATGDLAAQRLMADMAIWMALSGGEGIDPATTLSEGLIFARMAAVRGEHDDEMRVITMLALSVSLSVGQAADDFAGEAIARLELLADGDSRDREGAAELLANADESESVMSTAQIYRDRLKKKEPAE